MLSCPVQIDGNDAAERKGGSSAAVFIDCDNHGSLGNLSESHADSKFPSFSALVHWWFIGVPVFSQETQSVTDPCVH